MLLSLPVCVSKGNDVGERAKALRNRAAHSMESAPPFGVQFPILFIVFLFFAAGDLFALHEIRFNEGKYLTYRETFRAAAASIAPGLAVEREVAAAAEIAAEGTVVAPVEPAGPGPLALIIFCLLFLSPLVLSLRRWDWWALGLGMAALHALGFAIFNRYVGLAFLGPEFKANAESMVDLAFGVTLPISFAWLVVRAKVWSLAYAVLICVTYPFVLAISPADGSVLRSQILPFLSLHLSFVLLLLLLRTVLLIFFENLYVLRSLSWSEFVSIAWRTLLKWTPILLFALPYFTFNYYLTREGKLAAYEERLMQVQLMGKAGTIFPPATIPGADCTSVLTLRPAYPDVRERPDPKWPLVNSRDFEADTLTAIGEHFEEKTAEWCAVMSDYREELKKRNPERFPHFVGEAYDRVFTPGLDMAPPDHDGITAPATEFAAQSAQDAVEKAYNNKIQEQRANLVHEARKHEGKLKKGQTMSLEALTEFEKQGITALIETRRGTQASLQGGFFVTRAFNWLTFIFFCILCVRTLFYVFSRVACARDTNAFVTLGNPEGETEMPAGRIARRGHKLNLPMQAGETFYVARRFQPHGKAPKFAVPQSGAAPFPRIRNGCYSMNAFTHSEGRSPIQITATRGAEFVEWQLAEGEKVVFSYRYFVGMSSNLRLSALISARVTSQVFERFIFPTATGPGTLILMTEGAPHIGAEKGEIFSMPPSRLVAWQQPARFHIDSELGILDVYLSEAYVEPETQSLLIMDVDRQDSFGTGLSRFVRRFLLPV